MCTTPFQRNKMIKMCKTFPKTPIVVYDVQQWRTYSFALSLFHLIFFFCKKEKNGKNEERKYNFSETNYDDA